MPWEAVSTVADDRDVLRAATAAAAQIPPNIRLDPHRTLAALTDLATNTVRGHPPTKRPVLTLAAKVMSGTLTEMHRLDHPASTCTAAAFASLAAFTAAPLDQALSCIRPRNTAWTVAAELAVLLTVALAQAGIAPGGVPDDLSSLGDTPGPLTEAALPA